ncbi:MAG: hypothetical protein KGN16_15635 [Burkholderiales bacterium]|nr:hypothetical protein [Burkholderiales bacterium]
MTATMAFKGSLAHAATRMRRLLEGWTRPAPVATASRPDRIPGVYGLLTGCARRDD